MSELLDRALPAHGGRERWREVQSFDVRVSLTGALYRVKGSPEGVLKGIGESGGTIGAPPTIVHAVLDALAPFGIAHLDMPLTPPKIWASIQAAGADAKH
jgi:hypothetical protein